MRVLVMGAGVIGVTTAYRLAREGHEVTVIDRASEPSSFTSFANAGLVAPGHAYAWSSPRAPRMMLRSLWRNDQAIRFRPSLDPALWRWTLAFLRQCNAQAAARNTRAKARLCQYSQAELDSLNGEEALAHDARDGGLIYFYRSQATFDAAATKSQILRNEGVEIRVLDRDGVVAADPGLAPARERIAGALYAPTDTSGDARLFTLALAKRCAELGVIFRMGEEITDLVVENGRVRCVKTRPVAAEAGARRAAGHVATEIEADDYVLCLGVFSPHLVRKLQIKLPIYPIKGYSVTLPVSADHAPPHLGGVDEDHLLAYCPLGDRLRLTATAEFAGYSTVHAPKDFSVMLMKAREFLPGAADFARPQYWAGLRPMTPTGLPIIDRSPVENLWLNTGHGHMGWTMAAGSARILADLIGQRRPAIDLEGMRYAG